MFRFISILFCCSIPSVLTYSNPTRNYGTKPHSNIQLQRTSAFLNTNSILVVPKNLLQRQVDRSLISVPCHSITSRNNALFMTMSNIRSPIIQAHDTWGNIAALSATAAFAQKLGRTTSIGKLLGPPVTAMAIAFVFGSIGILNPGGSHSAKVVQLLSLQLATPMLLLGVNLQDCRKTSGPILLAFLLASCGTIVASIFAMKIPWVHIAMIRSMGEDAWKIAAALLAKNVGGGINYIAVCQTLQASPNAIAAGLCVDNIFALIYFPMTSILSTGKPDPNNNYLESQGTTMLNTTHSPAGPVINSSTNKSQSTLNFSVETISRTIALASILTWIGEKIGGSSGALPTSTLLTILFTTLFPWSATSLRPAGETLGTSLLYLFFATAGAPGVAIAESVRSSFLPISSFLLILYVVHAMFLIVSRFLAKIWYTHVVKRVPHQTNIKWDTNTAFLPQNLLVASSAAIGGPATAAALAQASGWFSLIGPSILVGNLGYAIATFCGLLFYAIFKTV